MRQRTIFLIFQLLFCAFVNASIGYCEDPAPPPSSGAAQAVNEPTGRVAYTLEIRRLWKDVLEKVRQNDLQGVQSLTLSIEELKNRAEISSLDDYSLFFISEGLHHLDAGDIDRATFYAQKALQLSPLSPVVALHSLRLVQGTGVAALIPEVVLIVKQIPHHPEVFFHLVRVLIYPALWAVTFGLYLCFIVRFMVHAPVLFSNVAKILPIPVRGIVAPLLVLAALVVPLLYGPLWCLVGWSFFLLCFGEKRRTLPMLAGAVIALWGVMIPVRENLKNWLDDEGMQSVLHVSSGVFSDSDERRIEVLLQRRSQDFVVWYSYGQLLRSMDRFKEAEEAFKKAEAIDPGQPWTIAEQGTVEYLLGNYKNASDLYQRAFASGLDTPRFLFNYSKVKFEALDLEGSKKLVAEVARRDPALANALREREKYLGPKAMSDVPLPAWTIFKSTWTPPKPLDSEYNARSHAVMNGMTPAAEVGAGVLLFLVGLACREAQKRRRSRNLFAKHREHSAVSFLVHCLPGSGWMIQGRSVAMFVTASLAVLAFIPIVGWPGEATLLIDLVPGFRPYYIGLVLFLWLVASQLGYGVDYEENV